MTFRRTILTMLALMITVLVMSGCHNRGFRGEKTPERLLEVLDAHVKELDLTEAQNTQYLDLRKRILEDLVRQQKKHLDLRQQVRTLIQEDGHDLKEITALLRPQLKEMSDHLALLLDYTDDLLDILDERQQELVKKELRDRFESRAFTN